MEPLSFTCLYCGDKRDSCDASLEHAIPQFLGGDFAPPQYMLRNVCKQCNNRLGLFVDASYAKSWCVTNALTAAARRLYTGSTDEPLPLICIGRIRIPGLVLESDQIVENWIGPSGETVIWLRTHDERLIGYSGGNPIDKKKKRSTAYFFPTSQNKTRWQIGIASFFRMFRSHRVRKILGIKVLGAAGNEQFPGFEAWSKGDEKNVTAIMAKLKSGSVSGQIEVHERFDQRFIAKMALGIGYSLFGEQYLDTDMSRQARMTCWPTNGKPGNTRGRTTFAARLDPHLSEAIGYPGAIVLAVVKGDSSYSLIVTIDQELPFMVELAPSQFSSHFISNNESYVLVLCPSLGKAMEMTLAELVSHSSGIHKHPGLQLIDARLGESAEFWRQLDQN